MSTGRLRYFVILFQEFEPTDASQFFACQNPQQLVGSIRKASAAEWTFADLVVPEFGRVKFGDPEFSDGTNVVRKRPESSSGAVTIGWRKKI
jgi:hypothetical protein